MRGTADVDALGKELISRDPDNGFAKKTGEEVGRTQCLL